MQVKEIKQDGLSHEIEVTVEAKDINNRVDTRLQEVSKTIKLPGFRPGKVPMNMLKKRYGKTIMGEVLEAAVNETSAKALEDKKLIPAMQPKIEVKEFDDGKDLVYTMNVEVLPKFELVDFKKAELEKPVAKPDDASIDEALERIASSNESTQAVTGKRGAKDGDTVVIDFDGRTADDDVHQDGMKAEGHRLKLGSGAFIPGFEDQLKGKKAGDEIEVKVSFPENYGAKELAGRDAIFEVKVHELLESAEAKIDDEFAKTLGMDDVKALREAVSEQIVKELEQHSRMNVKKDLLDYLDDVHELDVPPSMLEIEYKNILDQLELEKQRNPEENKKDVTDAEKAEFKDIAARRVRLGLILSEIGRQNGIQVSDMDLQKAVITEAQKYPGQEKDVFDYYSKNQQALDSLRAPLFEEKVVDYILELAQVTEKEVKPDELFALLEEDGEKPKKKDGEKDVKKAETTKKSSVSKGAKKKSVTKKKAPVKKKVSTKKKKAS
ncbi:MAG: trigger factor [Alphaproteobacteria bacterium]|nr:trigger factor [Alphaproteobacteria bacterium]